MTTDDQRDLGDKIFMGAEVERFLATPLGKYMVTAIEEQRESAIREFAITNAADVGAVLKVQMKILQADQFQQWLADILITANEAMRVVEQQDFTD